MTSPGDFIRSVASQISGLHNLNSKKAELSPMRSAPASTQSSRPRQDEFIGRALAKVPSTDTHISNALPTLASMIANATRTEKPGFNTAA